LAFPEFNFEKSSLLGDHACGLYRVVSRNHIKIPQYIRIGGSERIRDFMQLKIINDIPLV